MTRIFFHAKNNDPIVQTIYWIITSTSKKKRIEFQSNHFLSNRIPQQHSGHIKPIPLCLLIEKRFTSTEIESDFLPVEPHPTLDPRAPSNSTCFSKHRCHIGEVAKCGRTIDRQRKQVLKCTVDSRRFTRIPRLTSTRYVHLVDVVDVAALGGHALSMFN